MSLRIATRSSIGLRAQSSGGQSVLDIYQTVHHYLERSFSSAHANLFAEPNMNALGGEVDWYSPLETADTVQQLTSVPEPRRGQLYANLTRYISDIRVRAGELKSSAKQSDRLMGQLLAQITEVPGEEFVYAVGEQPVLIFWGHLLDVPMPTSGVIDRMIARRAAETLSADKRPAAKSSAGYQEEIAEATLHQMDEPRVRASVSSIAGTVPEPAEPKPTRHAWLTPLLWVIFAALCVAIGLKLLSGCGIGSPFGASGDLWINYCPIPTNDDAEELNELTAENADLQHQLDRLVGNVTGRRAQCSQGASPAATPVTPQAPPPTPPPPPAPAPPPDTQITIPKGCTGQQCLAALEGCWGDQSDFTKDKEDYGPDDVTFCFDKRGNGKFFLKTQREPRIICKGPVKAETRESGEITVTEPLAPCNVGNFREYHFTCRNKDGLTTCEAPNDPGERANALVLHRRPGTEIPDE